MLYVQERTYDDKARELGSPLAVGADLDLYVKEVDPADRRYLMDSTITRVACRPEGALTWEVKGRGRLLVHGAKPAAAVLTVETAAGRADDVDLPVVAPASSELVVSGVSQEDIPEPLRGRRIHASSSDTTMGKVHFEPVFFDTTGTKLLGFGITRWGAEPGAIAAVEPFLPRTNSMTIAPRAPGFVSVRAERPDVPALEIVYDEKATSAAIASLFVSHHRCIMDHCLPYLPLALEGQPPRGRLTIPVGHAWTLDVHALDDAGNVLLPSDSGLETKVASGTLSTSRPYRLVSFHAVEIRADAPGDSTIQLAYGGRVGAIDIHAE